MDQIKTGSSIASIRKAQVITQANQAADFLSGTDTSFHARSEEWKSAAYAQDAMVDEQVIQDIARFIMARQQISSSG